MRGSRKGRTPWRCSTPGVLRSDAATTCVRHRGMGTRKSCQTERRGIGGTEPFGQVINTIGTASRSIVRRYMWTTLSPLLIEPGRSHQRRQGSEYSGHPVFVSPHWPAAIMILRKLATAQAGEDRSGYEACFPYPK